jgi:hypothetical protein
MIRTSIVLPAVLHQQLLALAKQADKTLSEFVREQLGEVVTRKQQTQLDEMYAAIWKMKGQVKDPITDASQTIDEVLYGENGAWRGSVPPERRGVPHLKKSR